MNELAPRFSGTGLMSRDDLAKSLNNASMTMPRVGGDKQFLKLDKGNGQWIYGQEETLVEDDALWAVNPASFEHGYIAWDEAQLVEGEVMVPISRNLPAQVALRTSAPDGQTTGQNGWQFQMSVDMVCIKGEDEGTVVQYKQSSVGAMKAFRSLTDAVGTQLADNKDEIVPIIVMKSDSYKHKKWGRIFNPIFEIVEWRTMDDNSAPAEAAAEPEKPAARTRTAAATAPTTSALTPEEEEEALAKEYEATQAAQGGEATPRRRIRR